MPAAGGMRHQPDVLAGGQRRVQGRHVQQRVVGGQVRFGPAAVQGGDARQVGQFPCCFQRGKEIGKARPIADEAGFLWQVLARKGLRCRFHPGAADQSVHRRIVGQQCVDAALEDGIAIDREGRLRQQRGNAWVVALPVQQGLQEAGVVAMVGGIHAACSSCVAAAGCSKVPAMSRSASSTSNAGTLPSRSIRVGRSPVRASRCA